MSSRRRIEPPVGFKVVFRKFITRKDGSRLYAWERGKKAFALIVPDDRLNLD